MESLQSVHITLPIRGVAPKIGPTFDFHHQAEEDHLDAASETQKNTLYIDKRLFLQIPHYSALPKPGIVLMWCQPELQNRELGPGAASQGRSISNSLACYSYIFRIGLDKPIISKFPVFSSTRYYNSTPQMFGQSYNFKYFSHYLPNYDNIYMGVLARSM